MNGSGGGIKAFKEQKSIPFEFSSQHSPVVRWEHCVPSGESAMGKIRMIRDQDPAVRPIGRPAGRSFWPTGLGFGPGAPPMV